MKKAWWRNRWIAGTVVMATAVAAGIWVNEDVSLTPRRDLAELPALACFKQGGAYTGFSASVDTPILREYPVLRLVTSLGFDAVRVVEGDVRMISGGFAEAKNPSDAATNLPGNWYDAYNTGSYGSYGESNGRSRVGLTRLNGQARLEIRARGGRLIKFRGAPLASDTIFFDGDWERPGDDPAFTARVEAFLKIAMSLNERCR